MRVKVGAEVTLVVGLMVGTAVSRTPREAWGNDECFREVGRGLRLESSHVDKYVRAGSFTECERSCNSAFFSCKSFSYSDYHTVEPENCLLSREDTYSLDVDDPRDFYLDRDFKYYERTSGIHCQYDHDHQYGVDCYELVKTRERIKSYYILRGGVLRVEDRKECEEKCTRERDCRGFNYRYKTLGYNQYRDNCELSSKGSGDNYDFDFDDDFDFYEQSGSGRNCHGSGGYSNNGRNCNSGRDDIVDDCFRLAQTETSLVNQIVRESLVVNDICDCEYECTRSRYFTCRSFAFRYDDYNRHQDNCFLTDMEYRDMSNYDLVQDRSSDYYERRLYDRECGGSSNYETAGDVTVSGTQCYRDSCRIDREGEFYYCDIDYSGAWDYCCNPDKRCDYYGHSQRWCDVGYGPDRWRPCQVGSSGRDYLRSVDPTLVSSGGNYSTNYTALEDSVAPELLDLNEIKV